MIASISNENKLSSSTREADFLDHLSDYQLLKITMHYEVRLIWEDTIKTDLRETRRVGMDCINLAQNRNQWRDLVYMIMNLRVP